jgi:hypothetical protein
MHMSTTRCCGPSPPRSRAGRDDVARGLSAYPELDEEPREWETFRHGYFYD